MWVRTKPLIISLLFAFVTSAADIYKKVGDDVVLLLGSDAPTEPIKNILWKHEGSLAIEMEKGKVTAYRHFKVRGKLDTSTAALTISALEVTDSGRYMVDINDVTIKTIHLQVLKPVPKPSVEASCDDTECKLTCSVGDEEERHLSFGWVLSGLVIPQALTKHHVLTKEKSANMTGVSCTVENKVSQQVSDTIGNPFLAKGNKLVTGVIVFATMTAVIALLTVSHRLVTGLAKGSTGVWFYQKSSMPWDSDFWKKQSGGRAGKNAVEVDEGKPEERENIMTRTTP